MKADQIIKNAKIFTSDKNNPQATALVVKDGKFVYVGDEAGLANYEGEVTDLGGKFIMPGIIDSHMHITIPVGYEYAPMGERIEPNGKVEALEIMAKYIKDNPGEERYRFLLDKKFLKEGEDFVKEDLDAICPDAELQIQEAEATCQGRRRMPLHGEHHGFRQARPPLHKHDRVRRRRLYGFRPRQRRLVSPRRDEASQAIFLRFGH